MFLRVDDTDLERFASRSDVGDARLATLPQFAFERLDDRFFSLQNLIDSVVHVQLEHEGFARFLFFHSEYSRNFSTVNCARVHSGVQEEVQFQRGRLVNGGREVDRIVVVHKLVGRLEVWRCIRSDHRSIVGHQRGVGRQWVQRLQVEFVDDPSRSDRLFELHRLPDHVLKMRLAFSD